MRVDLRATRKDKHRTIKISDSTQFPLLLQSEVQKTIREFQTLTMTVTPVNEDHNDRRAVMPLVSKLKSSQYLRS